MVENILIFLAGLGVGIVFGSFLTYKCFERRDRRHREWIASQYECYVPDKE